MLSFPACSSSDTEEQKVNPLLEIHVFTPDYPVVTRADKGPVASEAQEMKLTDLRIWVFESSDGKPVGYLNPAKTDYTQTGGTFLMKVSDDFANRKPNVDVYVMANVNTGNCNITSVPDGSATRDALDNIMIEHSQDHDPFGLSSPKTSLGENDYLPMSGVLKGQQLTVNAPVLSVGNVQVVRAVSKVRFIFSSSTSTNQELKIKKITFDGSEAVNNTVIPKSISKSEYLFLNGPYTATAQSNHINSDAGYYEEAETLFDKTGTGDTPIMVPSSTNPAQFAWNGAQSGQEYENLINRELAKVETETVKREIIEGCRFYLRESDKQISGKIYYTVGESTDLKNQSFSLKEAGDFTRNHTWIVYGYFAGSNNLRIFTVAFTPWKELDEETHGLYNW